MKEKVKILCVEDDFDIRSNIAEILRDEGFDVYEAENGDSGFEVFLKTEPDLVISDVMMPNSDGYSLLKKIRNNEALHNHAVPFVFLSALGQKEDILRGVENLANDYLVKPVDFDLLLAKVREKTFNAALIQSHYGRNIENVKNQLTEVLSYEIFVYLNSIAQTINVIKSAPYGELATAYIEELERVYLQISRLKYLIHSNLNKDTLNQRLMANEQLYGVYEVFEAAVDSLGSFSKNHILIERPYNLIEMPKFRVDKSVIDGVLIKIFTSVFSVDPEAKIKISFLIDHFDQLVVIFYLQSKAPSFNHCIQEKEISKMLDCQACRFEVVANREDAAIMTIPSYRLEDQSYKNLNK